MWTPSTAHAPLCPVTSSNPTQHTQTGRQAASQRGQHSLISPNLFLLLNPPSPPAPEGHRGFASSSFPVSHFPQEAQLPALPAPHLCHCLRATAASWEAAAESPLAWSGKRDAVRASDGSYFLKSSLEAFVMRDAIQKTPPISDKMSNQIVISVLQLTVALSWSSVFRFVFSLGSFCKVSSQIQCHLTCHDSVFKGR